MRIINHPNIIKYKETILTKNSIYIITEYIPGEDLFQYVKRRKFLSEYESAFILGQILQAVNYLHGLEIIHRDLKPENIMVVIKEDENNNQIQTDRIKLIDFGLSAHVSEACAKAEKEDKIAGTPNYIAPELLMGQKPSYKMDNFAIGSILYFLLSGTLPFLGKNQG